MISFDEIGLAANSLHLSACGEFAARSAAGGGSLPEVRHPLCGTPPTPTLPRKRERERSPFLDTTGPNLIRLHKPAGNPDSKRRHCSPRLWRYCAKALYLVSAARSSLRAASGSAPVFLTPSPQVLTNGSDAFFHCAVCSGVSL